MRFGKNASLVLPALAGAFLLSFLPAAKGQAAGLWEQQGELWYYYTVPDAELPQSTGSDGTADSAGTAASDGSSGSAGETAAAANAGDAAEKKVYNGWLREGRDKYYIVDSRMMTGWIIDGGNWYYTGEDGKLLTNQWVGNFYVGPDGAALTGGTAPDGTPLSSYGSKTQQGVALEELDFKTANYVKALAENPDAYVEFTEPGDLMNEHRGGFYYVTLKRMKLYDPYTGAELYSGDGCFRVDAILERVIDGQEVIMHPSDLFSSSPRFKGNHIYTDPAGFIYRVTQ